MDGRGEFVAVVGRLPRARHVADELHRHLEFGLFQARPARPCCWKFDLVFRANLVGPAEGVEHQRIAVGNERSEMFPGMHHHPRDADHSRRQHGLAQQRIDLLSLGQRPEVVGLFEVSERYLARHDEGLDVDRLRRDRIGGMDLVFTQHDVFAARLLDALDDVVALDFLAGALVDALVAHRVHRAPVEPVEVDAGLLRSRVQGHRHVDEAEADGAFPDHSRHGADLSRLS